MHFLICIVSNKYSLQTVHGKLFELLIDKLFSKRKIFKFQENKFLEISILSTFFLLTAVYFRLYTDYKIMLEIKRLQDVKGELN